VALADVRARGTKDLAGARVRIGFSRGHLLEIVVFSHAVSSAADEAALDAANMLVPRIVGEQVFDEWVGSIDVAPLGRGGSLRVVSDAAPGPDAALPLTELKASVDAAIRSVDAQLPDAPYHTFCERAEWTLLEMTPKAEADYGAQDDLAFLSTMLPECMKSFLQGAPFSSRRFSRWNEQFAYVKIDVAEKSMEQRHELRIEYEDRLNALLVPGRVGCVVGAGLGVRYLYLELALERFDEGVRAVQGKLARLGVGPRAWILFCDSALRQEWVGIGDDVESAGQPSRNGSRFAATSNTAICRPLLSGGERTDVPADGGAARGRRGDGQPNPVITPRNDSVEARPRGGGVYWRVVAEKPGGRWQTLSLIGAIRLRAKPKLMTHRKRSRLPSSFGGPT
jgi:hypothetical protein